MGKIKRLILLTGLLAGAAAARADETPPFAQKDPAAAESSRNISLMLYGHMHDGTDSPFLRNILPETDSAWNIGAVGREWANGYFDAAAISTLNSTTLNASTGTFAYSVLVATVSGNLGVGLTSPAYKLDIAFPIVSGSLARRLQFSDTVNTTMALEASTAEAQWVSNVAIGLRAGTSGTDHLGISSGGVLTINGNWDGWVGANETWTYISSTQFSVPGDVTTKYQKGDKIKLTQTTAKYFYVTAVAAGVSVTTVTVTGGTDYTVANAAITSPFYSKMMGPQSFPTWFNYSPTITFTAGLNPASPGNNSYKFKIEGKSCTVQVFVIWGSAGTTVTRINFTPPVPIVVSGYEGFAVAAQNGLPGTQVPGVLEFTNGENLNGYFASGTVDRYGFVCTYEF